MYVVKYPSDRVEILPLDLASGEEPLKKAVEKAESLFSGSGVDYMVHNAAFERPVSVSITFILSVSITFILSYICNHNDFTQIEM